MPFLFDSAFDDAQFSVCYDSDDGVVECATVGKVETLTLLLTLRRAGYSPRVAIY